MENNNEQLEGVQHQLFKPRWWNNVEVTPHCWNWKGYVNPKGYGRVKTPYPEKKTVVVHRYVYKLLVGEIPKGYELDHLCHNRSCVNPTHLRPVTSSQNSQNFDPKKVRNRTGARNVTLTKSGKYQVVVYRGGKFHYGGTYDALDKAKQVASELRNKLFTHNTTDRLHH